MAEMKKMKDEELNQVSGGANEADFLGPWKTVSGLEDGYLALRSAPEYNDANEVGALLNGDTVHTAGADAMNGYVYVYAPSCGRDGWVNGKYLR